MDELENLYQGFQQGAEGEGGNQTDFLNLWGEEQNRQDTKPKPREIDTERLEEEIRGIYEGRKFLNRAIATFLGVAIASAGVNAMAKIGLPVIATGTLGGLVLAVFFGNAISKIKLEGNRPKFDGEFFAAVIQTGGVGTAVWMAFSEQREIEKIAQIGKERFQEEVIAYETKPQPENNPLAGGFIVGGALLLLAIGIALMIGGNSKNINL